MNILALLLAAAAAAAPEPEPPAIAPALRENVDVQLPPGTVFPAPEVTVVLALTVGADGKVQGAELEQGAGEPFDGAALAAASRLVFEPARTAAGEAIPVVVSFRLRIVEPPRAAAPERPPPVKLSGTLLERGTRRPLADVAVAARDGEETLASATTDAAGRFALEVPRATFRLVAVPPGHARLDVAVEARPGEERDETYYLVAEPSEYVTVIRGERVRREITRQVIPRDELELVAGTQGDTLKAVANLPGAARVPFGGGGLILRGSSPGDSAAFVDGLEIPQLFHFGALRSTFAPRFLESVEFVPGNFAADYGRRTGGIVNARVREPAGDLFRGEADFNLYDAGVAVEGPLSPTWAGGAAFRRSWVDTFLPLVLPKDAPLSFTQAPRFYDYQFLVSGKPSEADRLRLLFFGSQDKLVAILERPAGDPSIAGDLRSRIAFHALQGSWSRTFSPALKMESSLSLGLQEFDTAVGADLFFNLKSRRADLRSTWSWQATPAVEWRGGLDALVAGYDISLNLPRQPQEGQPGTPISTRQLFATSQSGTLYYPALFTEVRLALGRVSVFPSLRADWASDIGRWSLDPRLGVRWQVREGTVLKAAAGLYHQPPDPGESAREIGTPDLLHQRSAQYSAGLEQRLLPGVDLDTTAFYKDLSRQVVQNRGFGADPVYLNEGRGRVYGLELLVRARFGDRFFGWVAYTYQRSLRTDHPGDPERRFSFDQPHLLTALGTYKWNERWTSGARFRLVSGNPYTPVRDSVYDAASDTFVPLYGAVNSGRLATFHALDLRVDRTWTFERWRFSIYLDVQNVYNRGNQEGWQVRYDWREKTPLTGLPILPIFGLKGEW
ncbi:MAG: TonB-dependent receptor [Deltaproteobacteria bacterium]|nr:TonB-dependent receptor [Deltaproteobacteria bacterium]